MKKPRMISHGGFRPVIAYVDTDTDVCGSWGSAYTCEDIEEKTEDSWFIYKCMYCNHGEIVKNSCLAMTSAGKRCRKQVGVFGYCNSHSDVPRRMYHDAVEVYTPWKVESIEEYADRAKSIGMLLAKKDILTRIKNMRDVHIGVIYEKVQRNQEDCFIYFLRCGNYVKIGSSVNPEMRIEQLRKENDRTLKPKGLDVSKAVHLGHIQAARSVERDLHTVLNRYRVVGEWFEWTGVVEKTVEDALADELNVKLLIERAIEDPSILEELYAGDNIHNMSFLEKEIESADRELRKIVPLENEDEDDYDYSNSSSYGTRTHTYPSILFK